MKSNRKLDLSSEKFDESKGRFLRKGKVGDWKNYLTEEQSKAYDEVYEDFVKETGYTVTFE